MANLLVQRLTPAFIWIGLGYFDPYFTRFFSNNHKDYGVILTSLATRAVPIEIAHSLDMSYFLTAFRKFIARPGQVIRKIRDGGTNLKAGERKVRLAIDNWNNAPVHDFLTLRHI